MKWSIDFPIPSYSSPISHQNKILSLGSCFAETIGLKMKSAKFDCLVNPFGTIFNPLSLKLLLETTESARDFEENLICERDGIYFHYHAHSDLFGTSPAELLLKLREKRNLISQQLKTASHLILTFGTAWVYTLPEYGIVANCHKKPNNLFHKRLLSLDEMESSLSALFEDFSQKFQDLKIILTLSPVRHLKDGVTENQLSKSLLRVLCSNLERRWPSVSYFPAYEIMMDELRDYRFYKSDLIHPTTEAEDYIWSRWQASHFTKETQAKVIEIQQIKTDLAHRPIHPESPAHRKFLSNLLQKLERLNAEFDFSKEIDQIKSPL